MKNWYVYMLRCADGSLYTGVTTDLTRREQEHNTNDKLGARYTRCRRPVVMVWHEPHPDRASATRREVALKRLKRLQKEHLITAATLSG
ncbi:GIY-YIG nuclease family protein [Nitrincola sp. MINF-07-Sa-05]|uniref:GIY-YIG nuclease family protein n=1 Tax=Nitrincola salilacus TaxID=3400273 RepID=UPI003917CEE7